MTENEKQKGNENIFRACFEAFKMGFRRDWEWRCRQRYKALAKKYERAYPDDPKNERELLDRLLFLMSGCNPNYEGIFTDITEPGAEMVHRHIHHKHPDWKSKTWECVCGFKSRSVHDFGDHCEKLNEG